MYLWNMTSRTLSEALSHLSINPFVHITFCAHPEVYAHVNAVNVCVCIYCSSADAASNPKSITESSHAITTCHGKRWLLLLLY